MVFWYEKYYLVIDGRFTLTKIDLIEFCNQNANRCVMLTYQYRIMQENQIQYKEVETMIL